MAWVADLTKAAEPFDGTEDYILFEAERYHLRIELRVPAKPTKDAAALLNVEGLINTTLFSSHTQTRTVSFHLGMGAGVRAISNQVTIPNPADLTEAVIDLVNPLLAIRNALEPRFGPISAPASGYFECVRAFLCAVGGAETFRPEDRTAEFTFTAYAGRGTSRVAVIDRGPHALLACMGAVR